MTRCAAAPATPVFVMARLLVTLRALCAVAEVTAARKPIVSKVGEFQEAAAIPRAIGKSDRSASGFGSAFVPSSKRVINTVMSGIPHFDV